MGDSFLKGAVVGFVCAVLGGATVALAGSGVGGVFNLGVSNSVDAKTTLTGASPRMQLQVTNTSADASTSGLAVNSASGATTGVFTNTGGGPAGGFFVDAGVKPFTVNSQTRVGNLNADLLDGLDSTALQRRVTGTCAAGSAVRVVNSNGSVVCEAVVKGSAWSLTGNAGTSPGIDFLGTTDRTALELKVDGARALRLEPGYDSDGEEVVANVIGGYSGNYVPAGMFGATVAGGGRTNDANVAVSAATVGGGTGNQAVGFRSTVAGGWENSTYGDADTVGGGAGNRAAGSYSTIPGGEANNALGPYSFAAGTSAAANHEGSFVWGDHHLGDEVASPAANTFTVRASGGVWFGTTSTPSIPAGSFFNTSTGGYLSSGGVWTNNSDRSTKYDLRPLNTHSLLQKVNQMPITSWSYRGEQPGIRHIGPMAQDFYQAFGLGLDARHISTVDEGGVALAAIQALYQQNQRLRRLNQALNVRLTRLERKEAKLSR